jgi:hypothetical protein
MTEGPVLTVEEWIVQGYSTFYPSNLVPVITFLLAQIVHHKNWLLQSLPENHVLFNSRVWTSGIIEKLQNRILLGNGRNSSSGMTATGIPPHIILANEVAKVREEVSLIKIDLMNKLDALPEKVKTAMLENFSINGVVPITTSEVHRLVSELQVTLLTVIRQQAEATEKAISEVVITQRGSNETGTNATGYQLWSWGEMFHFVPEGFIFPT